MDADLNPSPLNPSERASVTGGSSVSARKVTAADLKNQIRSSAFAFRGYDVTNLGRSRELLEHETFGPTVARVLGEASAICSDVLREKVDLAVRQFLHELREVFYRDALVGCRRQDGPQLMTMDEKRLFRTTGADFLFQSIHQSAPESKRFVFPTAHWTLRFSCPGTSFENP